MRRHDPERFAEINRYPVTFTPETGHPEFVTYHGASEDRLPSVVGVPLYTALYPRRGGRTALRRVPLGNYLTRCPSGFTRSSPKD